MKLISFISVAFITGFLFIAILRLHPVGSPAGNPDVLIDRAAIKTDIKNVNTMDDYFLRNGQRETGANNIVSSVVFDYRGLDTLGEATVLFIVVTAISMLLYRIIGILKLPPEAAHRSDEYPDDISRIIAFGAFIMFPMIVSFGVYLVIHGHLSPGGGFQGGAVMASGTALLLISALLTRNIHKLKKIFSFLESFGLTIFIVMGFAGLGTGFLFNFLANNMKTFLGRTIEFGPNPGYLNSGGIIPILSIAIGLEVFFGLSLILVSLYHIVRYEDLKNNRR